MPTTDEDLRRPSIKRPGVRVREGATNSRLSCTLHTFVCATRGLATLAVPTDE